MGARLESAILGRAIATPATPGAGYGALFYNTTTKHWCSVDDAGVVTDLAASAAPAFGAVEINLSGATSYPTVIQADSPSGYWRLADPSGTAAVRTVGAVDGVHVNTPTLGVASLLPGSTDLAVAYTSASLEDTTFTGLADWGAGPVTLEMWFKRGNATHLDYGLIARPGTSTTQWQVNIQGATGVIRLGFGTGSALSVPTYWDTLAHHLAITKDATTTGVKIYVDGADVTGAVVGATPGSNTGVVNLAVDLASDFFEGSIDELAIYPSALSAARVLAHYQAGQGTLVGVAKVAGTFDITGLSGLTAGKPVMVDKAAGPYTGKGTLADEAEMDMVTATGYVVDATTVRCYWQADTPQFGNVKFNYLIGA